MLHAQTSLSLHYERTTLMKELTSVVVERAAHMDQLISKLIWNS